MYNKTLLVSLKIAVILLTLSVVGSSLSSLTVLANPETVASNPNLLPFFDQNNNPVKISYPRDRLVDITPAPPSLNPFDRALLQTCGPINSNVTADKFKKLMLAHPDVLSQVQKSVNGELRPGRKNPDLFLADLTDIWFNRRGFKHIFCGEFQSANKIGGLHFFGRYLQLQQQGLAGRLPNNSSREQVLPGVVYTVGVVAKNGNTTFTDTVKGYSYVTNGAELLIEVTQAFKAQGVDRTVCLRTVKDADTGKNFRAVFVKDRGAIVTFYPDVTPKGKPCQ